MSVMGSPKPFRDRALTLLDRNNLASVPSFIPFGARLGRRPRVPQCGTMARIPGIAENLARVCNLASACIRGKPTLGSKRRQSFQANCADSDFSREKLGESRDCQLSACRL